MLPFYFRRCIIILKARKIIVVMLVIVMTTVSVNHNYKTAKAEAITASIAAASAYCPGLAPYIIVAGALIAAGAVVIKNQDELLAISQWIADKVRDGGEWFGGAVTQAWFDVRAHVKDTTIVMSAAMKNLLSSLSTSIPASYTYTIPASTNYTYDSLLNIIADIPNLSHSAYAAISVPTHPNLVFYLYNLSNTVDIPTVSVASNFTSVSIRFDLKMTANDNIKTIPKMFIYNNDTKTIFPNNDINFVNELLRDGSMFKALRVPSYDLYNAVTMSYDIGSRIFKLTRTASKDSRLYVTGTTLSLNYESTFTGALGAEEYTSAIRLEMRDVIEDRQKEMATPITVDLSNVVTEKDKYAVKAALDRAFEDDEKVVLAPGIDLTDDALTLGDVMTGTKEKVKIDSGVSEKELSETQSDIREQTQSLTNTIAIAIIPPVFDNTLNALKNMNTSKGSPPKITINLNKLFKAGVSQVSPETNKINPFADKESIYIDFGMLNTYNFAGLPLIDYFRGIIGFGMIIYTFLHIWRRLMPNGTF